MCLYCLLFLTRYAILNLGDNMNKTIIYLIRHSEQLKTNEKCNATEDEQIKNEKIILSEAGEKMAKELSLNEELQNIDAVYSSNYARAIATAKYIATQNNLKINIDERLGERKLRKFGGVRKIRKDKKESIYRRATS